MASMASSGLVQGARMVAPLNPAKAHPVQVWPSYAGVKPCPLQLVSFGVAGSRATCRGLRMRCAADASDTLKQCQEVVAEQLGVDVLKVKPETKFADLGADSLDTVEIVMALEEKFKISIEQDGAEKIVTVKDAADVIHKLVEDEGKSA